MDVYDTSRDVLLDFLKTHEAGHLSTLTPGGKPHISTVYYYVDSFLEIYFVTLEETNKYTNIKHHPDIAFVVTDEKTQQTFQMRGVAQEVTDPPIRMSYIEKLAVVQARNKSSWPPPIIKLDKGHIKLIRLRPSWIRYCDFKHADKTPLIEESLPIKS